METMNQFIQDSHCSNGMTDGSHNDNMAKTFNGFSSEEVYHEVYEMVESIYEDQAEYDHTLSSIEFRGDSIHVQIDKYCLIIWDNCVEIKVLHGETCVLGDIVDMAAELARFARNGEFVFVFNPDKEED